MAANCDNCVSVKLYKKTVLFSAISILTLLIGGGIIKMKNDMYSDIMFKGERGFYEENIAVYDGGTHALGSVLADRCRTQSR